MVTDGQGSQQVREELSRNSTVPKPSYHSTGEVGRLHLFNISARWVQYMNGKITPTGVRGCFVSRKLILTTMQISDVKKRNYRNTQYFIDYFLTL